MPKLVIDGKEIEIDDGLTVMQACQAAGVEIPHFCFHERLNIAGNCRMCLVEIEKSPKPVASCAMPAAEGMVIHTTTPKVQKAREGVMEFLLINHPLDCPICDQGGECDLQDQAFKYGRGTNRFHENKRAVTDKYMGPLIKTQMTRCIHCTRCVRFATEIAGVPELGATGRGEHMQITTYLERALTSELSGNMIDICPVGALTSKPYAFKARSWELEHTESIDVLDAVGSNIRIDSKNLEVLRILPKLNEDINEEWLDDRARFSYDGLKNQRLDRPYIRKDGKLRECSWAKALTTIADKIGSIDGTQMAAIAGDMACVESMFLLKNLFAKFKCNNLSANESGYKIDTSSRGNYLFNTSIAGIEKADLCLLVGANPRKAAPILNARIKKAQSLNNLKIANIGPATNQTYKILELGASVKILRDLAKGAHEFAKELKSAKNPMIIIGDGVYSRKDGYALLSLIHEIVIKYNISRSGFNILHNHASIVGAIDTGFHQKDIDEIFAEDIKFTYLLGADNINPDLLKGSFIVYQGHHGDAGASIADVILPGAAYTEKSATYVNLEGRVQVTRAAIAPPGDAKEDWVIVKELAKKLGEGLEILALEDIRWQLAEFSKIFGIGDTLLVNDVVNFKSDDKLSGDDISTVPVNYYMTNVISRASVTMARCSQAVKEVLVA
jgi:NADH-quinone oxidoreductase subunit G